MAKFYLTTPIYYVNDKPHIGHAYTTLATDVLARYHRLLSDEVFFLTGTDEHGTKVAQSAKQAGQEPQKFCDQVAAQFQLTWDSLNISNDDFIRTTEARHEKSAQKFLQTLKDKGVLYKDKYSGLYCSGCEKFITEKELVDGLCPSHQKPPEKVTEENYFFKLKDYFSPVKKLIEQDKIKILPAQIKKEVLGLFKQGLDDFSVSREHVEWGIPLPFESKQRIYVWVEALHNYLSAIGYEQGKHTRWWPADIQLMAKDIIKFHAIYWPAILLALGEKPPKVIFAHGFFTVNGQKMSKSLGNVIDPNEVVKKYGVDGTRYLLLSQFPFGTDGDVQENQFTTKYNADLANGLGNLVSRVTNLIHTRFQGQLPVAAKEENQQEFQLKPEVSKQLVKEVVAYVKAMASYQLDVCLDKVLAMLKLLDLTMEELKPWQKDITQDKLASILYGLAESLRIVVWLVYPFMPETAEKIFDQLGIGKSEKQKDFQTAVAWGGLPIKQKIKKAKALFPRL